MLGLICGSTQFFYKFTTFFINYPIYNYILYTYPGVIMWSILTHVIKHPLSTIIYESGILIPISDKGEELAMSQAIFFLYSGLYQTIIS